MTVTVIAAVARNGVIGAGGAIPWRLTGEQAHFKTITSGHVLVMGRRTYESIGRPLPDRTTVVVTRDPDWAPSGGRPDGLLVATSVSEALETAARIDDEVYVAGGAQVYAACLPCADELLITEVDAEPEGDTVFPALDWDEWVEVAREPHSGWAVTRYRRATVGNGYKGQHGDSV